MGVDRKGSAVRTGPEVMVITLSVRLPLQGVNYYETSDRKGLRRYLQIEAKRGGGGMGALVIASVPLRALVPLKIKYVGLRMGFGKHCEIYPTMFIRTM